MSEEYDGLIGSQESGVGEGIGCEEIKSSNYVESVVGWRLTKEWS